MRTKRLVEIESNLLVEERDQVVVSWNEKCEWEGGKKVSRDTK